jgi:hypothetical protein
MDEPKPSDYDSTDDFERAWQEYNEGGQIIEVEADEDGKVDPDSLLGPFPGVDDD